MLTYGAALPVRTRRGSIGLEPGKATDPEPQSNDKGTADETREGLPELQRVESGDGDCL
jgi:hypothetical protein